MTRVEKFLYRKLLKVSEAAHLEFFSLSYFYDRAVDLALLGKRAGATPTIPPLGANDAFKHLTLFELGLSRTKRMLLV